jgi:ABC-type lipoprotein export system ATPase subunit
VSDWFITEEQARADGFGGMTTVPLVQIRDVTRSFESRGGRPPAVDRVSLNLHEGEIVAIVGRSGSGKSTLVQMVGALDTPDHGQIVFHGMTLSSLSDAERTVLRRDRIGFVFQDSHLVPTLSVLENVALTSLVAGRRRSEWADRAHALLDELGLDGLASARPATLSGGESQRVALARALFSRPSLVLADEPTGALDSATSRDVLRLLRGVVVDDQASAVVVVTHGLETACIADRIIVLRDGRVIADERFTPAATTDSVEGRAHEERVRAWLAEHR